MTVVKSDRDEARDPLVPKDEVNGNAAKTKYFPPLCGYIYNSIGGGYLHFIRKRVAFVVIVLLVIIIYLHSSNFVWNTGMDRSDLDEAGILEVKGYLVYSDKCKMPNINPYTPDVMKHFKREKYESCRFMEPLTSTRFNEDNKTYILHVDEWKYANYSKHLGDRMDCCYQEIKRSGSGEASDKHFTLGSCISFNSSQTLPATIDNILVKCKSKGHQVYVNAHAMMPWRPNITSRLEEWRKNDTKKPVSVLLIGIDSISRQNLIRAMPKTAKYLNDNEWFQMNGYNKIDDNTFPNLMALLAGYNQTTAFNKCNPRKIGNLNKCPLIWNDYQKYGYVTAYAEDEASISTFNYLKSGFKQPPVDYYLRPFLLAAEHHLPTKKKSSLTFCLGNQHSADYVYDYALELAINYKDHPYFGLFWGNTFSHNAISDCSSMDEKMVNYLNRFSEEGVLNRSVVIFFSDHGIRFGPTRKLLSGYYEERLPFFFMWLPPWLKEDHPEFVNALSLNRNRLTNPFDVHMTLKHLLELSGRTSKYANIKDCPNCQSLLRPVPRSRSCEDIRIEDHWCACHPFVNISTKEIVVQDALNYTIDYINEYMAKNKKIAHLCAKIKLHKIKNAYKTVEEHKKDSLIEKFRLTFETLPGHGLFEASVAHNTSAKEFSISGIISRLNSYAKDSACIGDGGAKKYCFCVKSARTSGRAHASG